VPYRHPVAVTANVLWWGIFLGCLGGSLGALLGLWAERTPAPPSRGPGGAGTPPGGADSPAFHASFVEAGATGTGLPPGSFDLRLFTNGWKKNDITDV
jgi:hypothetical protein